MTNVLAVENLVKRFGGLLATDNLSFQIKPGELHAVIGPNGAGKTTLIQQLSGELPSDAGKIIFNGEDITRYPAHRRSHCGLGRSYQITSIFDDFTALENVAVAVQASLGHSFRFWRPAMGETAITAPAMAALAQVGLAELAHTHVAAMAHGARRQLEIAMTLAGHPKLIMLDEPMAGMSSHESADIVKLLEKLKGTVTILLVEHDMNAVFALADSITVLVYGQVMATGSAADIRANREVRDAYLGDGDEAP